MTRFFIYVGATSIPLGVFGFLVYMIYTTGEDARRQYRQDRQLFISRCLDRGGTLIEHFGGSAFTPDLDCKSKGQEP